MENKEENGEGKREINENSDNMIDYGQTKKLPHVLRSSKELSGTHHEYKGSMLVIC